MAGPIKFIRKYTMSVEQQHAVVGKNEQGDAIAINDVQSYVKIPPELTCDFEVVKSALTEGAKATFRVTNLPKDIRDSILKSYFDGADIRGMNFYAGYKSQISGANSPLPLVFKGQLMSVSFTRASGSPDDITTIEAIDSLWDRTNAVCADAQGNPLPPFPAGTTVAHKVRALAQLMPYVSPNVVISAVWSEPPNISTRVDTYTGNVWSNICELTQNKAFIDNGVLYVLSDTDVLPSQNNTVTLDETVILGEPRLEKAMLYCDIIFEPSIINGMAVYVDTAFSTKLTGWWKVYQVTHKGMISPAVDTGCVTTVTLWKGPGNSPSLNGATQVVQGPKGTTTNFLPFTPAPAPSSS